MSFENHYKKFLKENGFNEDDSMTKKEMMELQAAINNSKDTASLEEEQREYARQDEEEMQSVNDSTADSSEKPSEEKSFTFKPWNGPKTPHDLFDMEKDILPNQKELEITFQNMLQYSEESLEIVYHDPVYSLPIPTNPRYQKHSIQARAKLLYDYHSKVSALRSSLAKKSLHRAPFSKPILPSKKCKASLQKNASVDEDDITEEFLDQISPQEFYVSRAGRQVKRKIYTEDAEIDSDSDFATSIKKNKPATNDSETKITMDTPYVPEENHTVEKTTPKSGKMKKDTPKRPLPLSIKKTSRAEVLFENLINEDAKMKQKQKEMDSFHNTLPDVEELDEDKLLMDDSPVKEVLAEESEENFIRKRVVPPIPARKPIKSKKQITQEDFDKINIVAGSPPSSPVLKQYANINKNMENTKTTLKTPKSKEILINEETSVSKVIKTDCPICGRSFLQSEIETHASTCGIEDEIEEFPENNSENTKISCDICDRVFTVSTNYEVHVKRCIAEKAANL